VENESKLEPRKEKAEKHLHIDNFPYEVKMAARKKAMDTHPSFKQWVIDLFKAACTGEPQNGIHVVIDSTREGEQAKVRGSVSQALRASATKKRKP